MCGIIAVVRRRADRHPPSTAELTAALDRARTALAGGPGDPTGRLEQAAVALEEADRLLRGTPGVRALLDQPSLLDELDTGVAATEAAVDGVEATVEAGGVDGADVEAVNAGVIRVRDAAWAIRRDRLRTAREVAALAGDVRTDAAIDAYTSVQVALSALDRLEVRGRDSAGLHLLVDGHGLDLDDPEVRRLLGERARDSLFTALAVRTPGGRLSIVYKAAAEIGELGDNSAALRRQVAADPLLRRALAADTAQVTVLGHTRWASVGIISEANAHPLNSEEPGVDGPYVTAALNGDVDNYADLRDDCGLLIPPEVTTDAKVIPTLVSRAMAAGAPLDEAFRQTVASFEGSVAVAANAADDPGGLLLALRGSGQALYVGLAEDAYVVASEPYGVVEETSRYVRMDGETPAGPTGEPGQAIVLDGQRAGQVDGIRRLAYDGTPLPVTDDDVVTAEVTTRDIDRGEFPHYLLKEITEAPRSLRKTLRGKVVEVGGRLTVALGERELPAEVRSRLAAGDVTRIRVIGQGTAAVAGQSVAASITDAVEGSGVVVDALPATELSGFGLRDDMTDTLVVAISQSGTTTDTNRTVDLARARGATVVSIVNRRNSDLVEKSHGVLYTSDGRDVEMSVASTKAFYAQIAAGIVLALGIGDAMGTVDRAAADDLLRALRDLPGAMEGVLDRRDTIADAAARLAPSRRYWAVVGNGRNRIAAQEIRIKLSELCYKSIACDATEDKKHIDLSSEPLIFVCAAGLPPATADDVAKEVAIYRAHKAAPIVVTTAGEHRFGAALATIEVPPTHPALGFVLSAMAGHLFGYEAALAIDAQALPLRSARAGIEAALSAADHRDLLDRLAGELQPIAVSFLDGLRSGIYDGHLEAGTAVQLASLLRYAIGVVPLDAYQLDHGKVGTPGIVVEDLTNALTRGIDQLTRPVDAIKHQAKTVTVGISRSEEALLESNLTRQVLGAGAGRDRLSYATLRTLQALDPAVEEVTGYTHYAVEGSLADRTATVHVLDKGGIAAGLTSRAERDPSLRGTKHRAASERRVTVARGASDGRTVVIVPEVKDGQTTGLALLHVRFRERLAPAAARGVLEGYQGRYAALADAVTETEPGFADALLGEVPVVDLLTQPVNVLAERWRAGS